MKFSALILLLMASILINAQNTVVKESYQDLLSAAIWISSSDTSEGVFPSEIEEGVRRAKHFHDKEGLLAIPDIYFDAFTETIVCSIYSVQLDTIADGVSYHYVLLWLVDPGSGSVIGEAGLLNSKLSVVRWWQEMFQAYSAESSMRRKWESELQIVPPPPPPPPPESWWNN